MTSGFAGRLVRNVASNAAFTVFSVALRFFAVPLYLRYLGTESIGLITLYGTVQAILAFFDMGLATAFSREVARCLAGGTSNRPVFQLAAALEPFYTGIGLVLGSLISLLGPTIAMFWLNAEQLPAQEVATVFRLYGLIFLFAWTGQLYQQGITGFQALHTWNLLRALSAALDVCGSIVVVLLWRKITAYFVWQVVVMAISTLLYRFHFWKLAGTFPDPVPEKLKKVRALLRVSIGLNLYAIFSMAFYQVDRFVISKFCTLADLGVYGLAATFPMALFYLVYPITSACYPHFSYLAGSSEGNELVRRRFLAGAAVIASFVVFGAMNFFLLADLVIHKWLAQPAIADAVVPLARVMMAGALIQSCVNLPVILMMASGQAWRASLVFGIALLTQTLGVWLLVPRLGLPGAVASWFASSIVLFLVCASQLRPLIGLNAWRDWLMHTVAWPLVIAVGALLLITWATEEFRQPVALPVRVVALNLVLLGVAAKLLHRQRLHIGWRTRLSFLLKPGGPS